MGMMFNQHQFEKIGEAIVEELQLKPMKEFPDRYDLANGSKTKVGLAKTVLRIFEEAGNE